MVKPKKGRNTKKMSSAASKVLTIHPTRTENQGYISSKRKTKRQEGECHVEATQDEASSTEGAVVCSLKEMCRMMISPETMMRLLFWLLLCCYHGVDMVVDTGMVVCVCVCRNDRRRRKLMSRRF